MSETTTTVEFSVVRRGGTDGLVTVDITTSDGSAAAGQDYGSITTTATFGDGDAGPKTGGVVIFDDISDEGDETFELTLVNPTGGVAIASAATATVTILDDDAVLPTPSSGAYLNDTGVTGCATDTTVGDPCDGSTGAFPGQDGQNGRDVSASDDSDGRAGFSFSKLDANGAPLSDQSADYATAPWSCVEDQVTGLMWETKTDDGSLRDGRWTYSWFDSGRRGAQRVAAGSCDAALANCDTEAYVDAINAAALCGYSDWRLPTRHELLSIVDFGTAAKSAIDANYFPNTLAEPYWSASQPGTIDRAIGVAFSSGGSIALATTSDVAVRLVRGGF